MADRAFDMGDRIGRYVVRGELGRGGMGRVLRAHDPKLNREVGLKEVQRDELGSLGARRLVAEARAMAKLSHPNVVPVYDVIELADDHVVVVMEYVDGQTLTKWLQEPRPWREVIAHFVQAGRGLAAAHAAGLLHRDFKPDNVLVGRDGRVRVTDFGLAREIVPEATEELEPATLVGSLPPTGPGSIVGTLGYLAPERLFGAPADRSTDQYAFCVALWEALFGERPFKGRTVLEQASSVSAGPPTPPIVTPEVPATLIETVKRGLSKNADKRWPDMESLLAALEAEAEQRVQPRSRWRPVWMAAGGVAAVGAVAIALVLSTKQDTSQPTVPPPASPATVQGAEPAVEPVAEPEAVEPVEEPASVERVELRAAASPRSATIYLDGTPLDGNPAVTSLPRGDTVHRIEARAEGYQVRTIEFVADDDHSIVLDLTRPQRRRSKRADDKLPIEREPPWKRNKN